MSKEREEKRREEKRREEKRREATSIKPSPGRYGMVWYAQLDSASD